MIKVRGLHNAARHVTLIGGNANNGTNAGAFYWNLNNDSGNANQNIGCRLSCYKQRYITLPLGKTLCQLERAGRVPQSIGSESEDSGTKNRQGAAA
jgi:hypothetical protein